MNGPGPARNGKAAIDDAALLAAVIAGDDRAPRTLIERHVPGGIPSRLPFNAYRRGLRRGFRGRRHYTWSVFTGDRLHLRPLEERRQVEAALRRVPLPDLRLRVVALAPGQSEIQWRVEPDGALGAARPDHPDREAAADLLLEVGEREVRDAVAILCHGR